MQASDNVLTPHEVHFDDTLAATRGRSNYYFSFATWPIGEGTLRSKGTDVAIIAKYFFSNNAESRVN